MKVSRRLISGALPRTGTHKNATSKTAKASQWGKSKSKYGLGSRGLSHIVRVGSGIGVKCEARLGKECDVNGGRVRASVDWGVGG